MSRIPLRTDRQPAPQPAKKPKLTRQRRQTLSKNATYLAVRDVYLEQNKECVLCRQPAAQVHHIVRGVGRMRSLLNSDTWLGVCSSECHDAVERLSWEMQMLIKQNAIRTTIERLRK